MQNLLPWILIASLTSVVPQKQSVSIDVSATHSLFRQQSQVSDFLRMLPPAVAKKLSIDDELAKKIRSVGKSRLDYQAKLLAKSGKADLPSAESEAELLVLDLEASKQQLIRLNELLTADQAESLCKEYFLLFSFEKIVDPIASQWLGLGPEIVAQLKELSQKHEQLKAKLLESYSDHPYQKIYISEAELWSGIPEKQLRNCFIKMGLVGENETLADYLGRFPGKKEVYINKLPAFAIAQLRADANNRTR